MYFIRHPKTADKATPTRQHSPQQGFADKKRAR